MTTLPVVVIGAGAAGLMATIHAARGPRPVVLLEGTRDGGRKILISGGGRCNILPAYADPARFVTDSPRPLVRNILRGWPQEAQRRFFEEELGLPLSLEAATGKLFPQSNRARDVRDGLVAAARRAGATLRFGVRAVGLEPPAAGGPWQVLLHDDAPIPAARVVVATGGLSVPSTGSDGAGLSWLGRLGVRLHPTYPALTPLTGERADHHALSGLSLVTRITAPGSRPALEVAGGFLFTHRGWSGPAVLDISHLAVRSRLTGGPRQRLEVQWSRLGAADWEAMLQSGSGQVGTVVRQALPDRLAALVMAEAGVEPTTTLGQFRRESRRALVQLLTRYPLPWAGDEGYRKAEVTGGGVALEEVAPHSLECRHHAGLHICGEALDAFGPIGGHNFLWAWATGRLAGAAAAGQGQV